MLPEQQQRILGYFIEEAKDHLNTIEQGLLNLQNTLEDPEMVNEIFRAAHSIKGGAAMLGLNSIQRTAHRLEDFFKVLKECRSVQIDQNTESLFLRVFDNLQALLEHLQGGSGLTEEVNQLMSEVEPVFAALQQQLEALVQQAGGSMLEEIYRTATVSVEPSSTAPVVTPSYVPVFKNRAPEILRQMLHLFKQPETPQTRQELESCCNQLGQVGKQFNLSAWYNLCQTVAGAIANVDNTYRTLAPIIIKELKQAQDLVLADRAAEVTTCEQLQALSILSNKIHPEAVAEFLAADLTELSTEAQIIDFSAEDELSSLFAPQTEPNDQLWQEASGLLEIFNRENDLDSSLVHDSGEKYPQISCEETLALNSLFGEEQDTQLHLTNEESAFCDLFKAPAADAESFDVSEVATPATSTENIDLSHFWVEEADAPTQIEFDLEEFSCPLGTQDLFAPAPESLTLPVDYIEAAKDLDSQIDSTFSNSSESAPISDDSWFVEPDLNLTAVFGQTLSSNSTEFLDPALDAMPTAVPDLTDELNLNLNSEAINSISQESELSFDIFEDSAAALAVENAANLMAEFAPTTSTDTAIEDESNAVELGTTQLPSHAESILEDALTVAELEAPTELSTASETIGEAEDFAELEALLTEELASEVSATAEALTSAAQAVTTTQSSKDELDDLQKLLHDTPKKPTSLTSVKPQQQAAANSRRPTFEQMMRVPVKHLDNISNMVGELVVYRNSLEQDQERLRQFLDNLLHQVQQLSDVGSRMQELYERSLLESSLLSSRQGSRLVAINSATDGSAPPPRQHITGINFDSLEMDRFTGFHTLSQEVIELIVRVREASSDIEFVTGETEQVARQFRQVTTQLQEGITRSRMVPFSQIADRLPRAVRDISLKYGKQAELHIEGKDALIDKVILEQLYDPMTHLVNNAITHGIESPEERSATGKPLVGQITIRAFLQGNQTVITVSDDGAGIDPEKVKAKAIKNGLITPEAAENMSRPEVYNLLFSAGFSTKEAVDEFAGRGIGMDVVLTSLSQIRGTITTDSTLGKGTTFTIRLPLTLSICKALCCLSDKAQIAFPMDGVEQMIDISAQSVIVNAQGQSCIPWRDSLLPFRPLKELLTFNRQISRGNIYGSNRDQDIISVVVLRAADMFIALQVDQVLGEQEIVIKQFEGPAPKPVGLAGATVLGDGRIMAIADVLELMDLSMGRVRHNVRETLWATNNDSVPPETSPAVKTEPMVLIVDDSITVRELLSMTFTNAGYRVEQARDGQEAWDKLRDGLPCDLVFCDIEMPRMDGLELLSRMQKDSRLSHLPIAMLTSRGSDRHRQMALQLGASGYFTKPYLEEALLDGAQRILRGEVLLISSINV